MKTYDGRLLRLAVFVLGLLYTLRAIQCAPDKRLAPFLCQHPFANEPRGIMPHMNPVSAGKLCYPVSALVLMKTRNGCLHRSATTL